MPAWRPRDASRSPSRDIDIGFSCRQFGHLVKDCSEKNTSVRKVWHNEERASKCKGCLYLYEVGSDEEEDNEEEESMAAMCHSGETCSAIQPNREEDDDYYTYLSQWGMD